MGDRYGGGYGRPRSPLYIPQRASLPINVGAHSTPVYEQHSSHAVPVYRRENRSSPLNYAGGPVITTTYKIKPDTPSRSTSRTRSATLDSRPIPTIVTNAPRARPVVHSSARPASPPLKTPRSSEEEYYDYAVPAATKHHRRRIPSVDKGLAQPVREDRGYIQTRPRVAVYTNPIVRHADSAVDDYTEDGYGYTNPRELVAYDLMNHTSPTSRRSRRDSHDGGRSRPVSITGLMDVQSPRSYDPRERGPPPSTRGFDRIPPAWEAPRGSVPPVSSLDPVQRPARVDGFHEPKTLLEPEVPTRRSSSRRPVSMYHDQRDVSRDARRSAREEYARDDYYDPRDDDLRERERGPRELRESRESRHKHERHESYDDERRAYRRERAERANHGERVERPEMTERRERVDRDDRPEKRGSDDRPERSRDDRPEKRSSEDRPEKRSSEDRPEKSSHDKVVAGLSIASAALGLGAMANTMKEDREEEPRRRDYDDEPRRHRDREEREPVDLAARDAKERRHRDRDDDREERRYREDDLPPPPPREIKERHSPDDTAPRRHREDELPPPPRERTSPDGPAPRRPPREDDVVVPPPRRPAREDDIVVQPPRDQEQNSPDFVDLGGRDPKEKPVEDDARPQKSRSEAATAGSAFETDSSVSDESINARPRRLKHTGGSNVPFNPKDTMDLMALKAALANKESSPPPPKETAPPAIKPATRESFTKDAREVAEIRTELAEAPRGRREPLEPSSTNTNRQVRVVSPPRENSLDKPVKGILRQPREKFPEDPSPIREGVAPLKDAKKDGVPPDARWTKIARKLVNPEALDVGKERYEARDDFVIVLRVLSREEIQAYASATQQIRAAREEEAKTARRRARREKHERHKRERAAGMRRHSESDDASPDEERPKMLEYAPAMSGGFGGADVLAR